MWRAVACLALVACDGVFGVIEIQKVPDAPVAAIDGAVDPSLVAWYKLDEGSGPIYADSSGHGHAGMCAQTQCPLALSGHLATAEHFDGVNDRIDVASAAELEGTFTVALWVFFARLPTGVGCPIGKLFGAENGNSWQVCIADDGKVSFYTSENPADYVGSTVLLSATRWHHIAFRWDGGMKLLSFDGVDVGQAPSTNVRYDGGALTIGADLDGGMQTASFEGLLDDIRIYNRALTTVEVTKLAQQ